MAYVGRSTLDQLTGITERLCCEYASRPPEELGDDAHHQLDYVQRLLAGSPRLAERRELLVIVSLRDGDIDRATDWAHTALRTNRKSVNDLSMITDELHHEAHEQFGDDPAINALNNVITAFSATSGRISPRTSVSSRVSQSHYGPRPDRCL